MAKAFFITGTDTDVGKTYVATALLAAANKQGLSTAALKPVAAGCEDSGQGLRNDDALALQAEASLELAYEQINPVALAPAIAPHIAAQQAGKNITVSRLAGFCRGVTMKRADLTLVEGAGGWRVPLNPRETLADLARELRLPVVLVVAMRLGCINHALLTAEAIERDGLTLAGWVANSCAEPMVCEDENLQSLERLLRAPCLGRLPYDTEATPAEAAAGLDLTPLGLG